MSNKDDLKNEWVGNIENIFRDHSVHYASMCYDTLFPSETNATEMIEMLNEILEGIKAKKIKN